MSRKAAAAVAHTIGIDTGKNTLHLIGLDQFDPQALHRVRSRLIGDRTAVIHQLRGFLLEHGGAARWCLFDHFVGTRGQCRRHIDVKRLGRTEIDDKLEPSGLHDRQVRNLFALENPPRIDTSLTVGIA